MKLKTTLSYLAAFLVMALPLLLIGNAGAGYLKDGAVQNGVTGGWVTPNDMVCIVGVHPDGTLDIADGVTNARDCIYLNKGTMNGGTPFDLTTMTNSNACTKATGTGGNDGAKHSWATSICVDGSGNGISLKDLDRTSAMCSAKGGTWVTTGVCVAYGRQFSGQDDTGTPLTFGAKGTTTAQAGFCYAAMNMTTAYSTSNVCPSSSSNSSTAYDWSFSSNKCTYAKGIAGYLNAALTKADGTTYAAGSFVDLSLLTTMGDCLANGGSWANWAGQPASTTSVATTPTASTIPAWDFTRQSPDPDNGCLHCHSSLTQYNGPAERFKDSYLKTGHKNMLRKVTAGKIWAGPNDQGVITAYTAAATGSIDFSAATANIGGVGKPLLYIFGDWMAPAPAGLDVVVDMGGSTGAKYNGTSNYSCAACHSTGWSNSDPTAGLCSLSSKTTSSTCALAGGTWYPLIGVQGIGTPGYVPSEPADSFPGVTFTGAGQWNLEGITCGRCHNATAPKVVATQIAASQFPSTHVTNGGMGALADGVGRTNLCFGCHQSIAKTNNGIGADADLNHPENLPVKNAATAPDYVPEFNGHVIGNQFLNSPHARYTGNIVPNALGKYDLEDTTGNDDGNASKYDSQFQGYTCWQSPTSSSPAKTMIVNGEIKEIKSQTDCENLYGAGAWRSDTQGTCSTCHDVHNSLFVADQQEAALRKVCTDCHNKPFSNINHLDGPGTPLGYLAGTPEAWEACVTCHMPRATSGGFPMHLWRINPSSKYSTFPTAKQFGIGATATKKNANASPEAFAGGSYTNAVWVDVDYACGQCHGGSFGPTATQNGAPYISKSNLSSYAQNMHGYAGPIVSFTTTMDHLTATLTDASTGNFSMLPPTITVNWGDKTPSSTGKAGDVFTHTYAQAKKFQIVYTVTGSDGAKSSKKIKVAPTFSITANISPVLPSDADFTLLAKNGKTVIATGTGTSSFVFSGLTAGKYKVKVEKSGYTFDGDGAKKGSQNPMTVVIKATDMAVNFTPTP
jgi:Doubled CXXCH motif (Paired_CXXCH_1)